MIARYRSFLEASLHERLLDELWARLMRAGLLSAALMLLWAKALALDAGAPGATREWNWWVAHVRNWA